MATVQVFYIVGTDPRSGAKADLAKFFAKKDADAHLDRYAAWHQPHVEVRPESIEDQHESHRQGLFAARDAEAAAAKAQKDAEAVAAKAQKQAEAPAKSSWLPAAKPRAK